MQIDELPGEDGQLDRPLVGVSPVNGKIFAFDVAQLPKLFSKTVELGEILFVTSQDADAPYALGLLRARRERPRRRRAAEQRDELAPLHVWMAPAWQEIIWRAAQRSLAVMCPAC